MPAQAGIHVFCNFPKKLDSRLRGNDGRVHPQTFCESIDVECEKTKTGWIKRSGSTGC
jgi:hypothetical protein